MYLVVHCNSVEIMLMFLQVGEVVDRRVEHGRFLIKT